MIELDLADRQEIKHDGKWCCYEIMTVKCPNCGMLTNITITYVHGTEYHHAGGKFCQVHAKNVPVPRGFESVSHLL